MTGTLPQMSALRFSLSPPPVLQQDPDRLTGRHDGLPAQNREKYA